MRSIYGLTWRALRKEWLRALLSMIAVAFGVATIVAANVFTQAVLNTFRSSDAELIMGGLMDMFDSILSLLGLVLLLAAGFLVFNAFGMAITQRRREIGALRSVGLLRGQVLRLLLVEAVVIGGGGAVIGLVLGPLVSTMLIAIIDMAADSPFLVFEPSPPALGVMLYAAAMGAGIGIAAMLLPARQAARVSPLEALRDSGDVPIASVRGARYPWIGAGGAAVLLLALFILQPAEWLPVPWNNTLAPVVVALWIVGVGLALPGVIGLLGRRLRGVLGRLWGAAGLLIADNVRRARGRVTLTTLSLVVALGLNVGVGALISFFYQDLMLPRIAATADNPTLIVAPFNVAEGAAGYAGLERIMLLPDVVADLHTLAAGRAMAMEWHFVNAPELGFFNAGYFSFVVDPVQAQWAGDWVIDFSEGDWAQALPIMEAGCGLLMMPELAVRHGVTIGDPLTITTPSGPLDCTLAGIGSTYVGATFISHVPEVVEAFQLGPPLAMLIAPGIGVDYDAFIAELEALLARHEGAFLNDFQAMAQMQTTAIEAMPLMLNALLLLAILAAAFAVVNTMLVSVTERRRELGLLRAVGATRGQVRAVVVGEAALVGVLGAVMGIVLGLGAYAAFVLTYGGASWGFTDMDVLAAVLDSVPFGLVVSAVGLIAAPLISAGAAWIATRRALREKPIDALALR